ncbi:hypothetical protein Pmar_PMAR004222 [Perkinsus marinus ATCC 50983]|uniref:Uncharacterized protein n=1 Tax=Perkinsus marinus (strain ATCC 50983 / TXsc) TaxID=423536 RepID=C5LPM9_PERM5|nr:hypothetical protein Pmar_PMAR004222 [Perkinsus marinus ATCC 50983]EER01349.1 hypothetical protein Pmar_PMAR004222 [Perkinsus marinus ATCC 50983]|eukprot:XP_002768631.1 hypothetical protein Pmar_PMAR004222 [Perkinsus marinus ATCC 50983]
MPGKRSAEALSARRKTGSSKRRRRLHVALAAVNCVAQIAESATRTDLSDGDSLIEHLRRVGKSAVALVRPTHEIFQDGSGLNATLPDLEVGRVEWFHNPCCPVLRIFSQCIVAFDLHGMLREVIANNGTPSDSTALGERFTIASDMCREALCKYLNVDNNKANCADYYASLFIALLKFTNDEDEPLPQCLANPNGLPCGITLPVPKAGNLPEFTPDVAKIASAEPPECVKGFENHYASAEVSMNLLYEKVRRDIASGLMVEVDGDDLEDLTFVKCALIAKTQSKINVSDPLAGLRVVEDYKANGVNRRGITHGLIKETITLPTIIDIISALDAVTCHPKHQNIPWCFAQLDYVAA